MSDTENRPQDQETEEEEEEEPSTDIPTSADPSDPIGGDEGDPPIIIQGGGSGNPG